MSGSSVRAIAIALGLVVVTTTEAMAQSETPLRTQSWEARYDGSADGWDDAVGLVSSPDGSAIFVTGTSTGSGTGRDYATAAYDADSGLELWIATYDGSEPHVPQQFGSGWDEPSALGLSPDGNKVFVTGTSSEVETDRGYGTVAYDAHSGEQLWVAHYTGPVAGRDSATALSVSPDGATVFVTGESLGDRTSRDYATIAYDAATGDQLWVARYDGLGWASLAAGWDTAVAIDVTPGGEHVVVTGYSFNPLTGNNDYATLAYDAITGLPSWVGAARYGGLGAHWEEPFDLEISPDGATVFITGSAGDQFARDYATIAYDIPSGEQLWEARYSGGTGQWNAAWALAASPDAVFITGGSLAEGTGRDYATIAYDPVTGTELWTARYDGPASREDLANSITVTPDSSTVLITGMSYGTATSNDMATLAYDAATGDALWLNRYTRGHGETIVASPDGSTAFVTGRVAVTGQNTPGIGPPTDWLTLAFSLLDPVIEVKDTVLELAIVGHGNDMQLRARLAESDSPDTGIPGKTISFYSDQELLGSSVTADEGVATLALPPGHRGANRTYVAVFAGDASYNASSDERPGQSGGGDSAGGTGTKRANP